MTKLSFRPINDIRIRGYHKAFQNCLDRTFENKDFNLPNIELDSNNVFSRLYNNVIVKNYSKNKYVNKSDDEGLDKLSKFSHNNDKELINNNLQLKDIKSTSTININSRAISPKNEPTPRKKEQKFNVTNIFKSYNGREFTKKITPKMYEKCLSSLSGGPSPILKKCMSAKNIKNSNNSKKYINYSAKLTTKNCFLKPNIKQYNMNSKNEDYISDDVINSLILANSNSRSELINIKRFRDVDYNTNLHMAVLKNSYKFVDYFIKKKLDVNKKNKRGDEEDEKEGERRRKIKIISNPDDDDDEKKTGENNEKKKTPKEEEKDENYSIADIIKEKKEIAKKAKELVEKEKQLNEREKQLNEREKELKRKEEEFRKKLEDLNILKQEKEKEKEEKMEKVKAKEGEEIKGKNEIEEQSKEIKEKTEKSKEGLSISPLNDY